MKLAEQGMQKAKLITKSSFTSPSDSILSIGHASSNERAVSPWRTAIVDSCFSALSSEAMCPDVLFDDCFISIFQKSNVSDILFGSYTLPGFYQS
jgi:hypothetical protein